MSSKYDNVLVKITSECDGLFLNVRTYQRNVGKSPEIWIPVVRLAELNNVPENCPLDIRCSYSEYVRATKSQGKIALELTWLTLSGDIITKGHRQTIYLNTETIMPGKFLCNTEFRENTIVYERSAHKTVSQMNKEERRAFSKWIRDYDCYHLGRNTIYVYRDWNKDFFFQEEGRWHTCGGINLSRGKRGLKYSMNT